MAIRDVLTANLDDKYMDEFEAKIRIVDRISDFSEKQEHLHRCKYVVILNQIDQGTVWKMKEWLAKNTVGYWYYGTSNNTFSQFAKPGLKSVFHFEREEDKVLFVLKWL